MAHLKSANNIDPNMINCIITEGIEFCNKPYTPLFLSDLVINFSYLFTWYQGFDFKALILTDPTLNNENIIFFSKPIISKLDVLIDTLFILDISDRILDIILFIPAMLVNDILMHNDILNPSNILFFMSFSMIDNRLLFLKAEKLWFSSYIYSYTFNFSFISASNKITLGSISLDILYIVRFITLSTFVVLLTLFVNVKYVR